MKYFDTIFSTFFKISPDVWNVLTWPYDRILVAPQGSHTDVWVHHETSPHQQQTTRSCKTRYERQNSWYPNFKWESNLNENVNFETGQKLPLKMETIHNQRQNKLILQIHFEDSSGTTEQRNNVNMWTRNIRSGIQRTKNTGGNRVSAMNSMDRCLSVFWKTDRKPMIVRPSPPSLKAGSRI